MRLMDLTGRGQRTEMEVLASPAAELLIQMETFASEDLQPIESFEAGRPWFDTVRSRLSPETARALARFGPQGSVSWGSLIGLAFGEPAALDVDRFLAKVRRTPSDELWLTLMGMHIAPFREAVGEAVFRRAVAGDPEAREEIVRQGRRFDGDDKAPPPTDIPPGEVREALLEAIEGWRRDVFASDEATLTAVLEHDAASKRALAGSMPDAALFEAATNGLEFNREPWMRRVVLLPHVAMRPWNILAGYGEAGIFCYPVADESLGVDASAPSARMVRLYKALGDEKRLRMLKRLAAGPATLPELAEVAGLAKSSAHHHTVILRSAGLIRVSAEMDSRYTLRREALPEASALLAAYLEEAR